MKKIFTLLTMVFSLSAFAQRNIDLKILSLLPIDDATYPNLSTGDTFYSAIQVTNQGTDSIFATDTLYFTYGGFLKTTSGSGDYIINSKRTNTPIPPGGIDTFVFFTTQGQNWGTSPDGDVLSFFPVDAKDTFTASLIARTNTGSLIVETDFVAATDTTWTIGANNQEQIIFFWGTVSSITNLDLSDDISVFPNPAKSALNISFINSKTELVSVKLFNIAGQQVSSKDFGMMETGSHTLPVNVSNLPAGVYTMQLTIGKNMGSVRFVIQN